MNSLSSANKSLKKKIEELENCLEEKNKKIDENFEKVQHLEKTIKELQCENIKLKNSSKNPGNSGACNVGNDLSFNLEFLNTPLNNSTPVVHNSDKAKKKKKLF